MTVSTWAEQGFALNTLSLWALLRAAAFAPALHNGNRNVNVGSKRLCRRGQSCWRQHQGHSLHQLLLQCHFKPWAQAPEIQLGQLWPVCRTSRCADVSEHCTHLCMCSMQTTDTINIYIYNVCVCDRQSYLFTLFLELSSGFNSILLLLRHH